MSVEIKDQSCESGKRTCTVTSVNPETGEFRVGFFDNGGHHSRLVTLDDLFIDDEDPMGKLKTVEFRPVAEVLAEVFSKKENPETK